MNESRMVEEQLKARGISDPKVLAAMETVPRELFVPEEYRDSAYKDGPLPIGEGQTISQPYMVALMTQCLELTGTERVLEIGTGSGYQMAVLLEITPQVYSIERLPALAHQARENLKTRGYDNLHIKVGDGTCGWPEEAPFDGIIVTAGAQEIPADSYGAACRRRSAGNPGGPALFPDIVPGYPQGKPVSGRRVYDLRICSADWPIWVERRQLILISNLHQNTYSFICNAITDRGPAMEKHPFAELVTDGTTKIVFLIMDGLGGVQIKEKGGTELQVAKTPNLDQLAS